MRQVEQVSVEPVLIEQMKVEQCKVRQSKVEQRAGRLARRTAAVVLLLSMLNGCSPEYNWREVRPAEQRYQVMFPGKPGMASRDINLDGQKVVMNLAAAQAGGHSFSVGVIGLPEDSAAARERALAAMRAQLVKNLAATETAAKPITVPVRDAQGGLKQSVTGLRIEARSKGQPNQLHGGLVAHGARAYQFLVVGNDPDSEQVQTFLESFRLLE